MSDPSAEAVPAPSASSAAPRRESVLGVFGIGLGLLLAVGAFALIQWVRPETLDGERELRDAFAIESLPAGWHVELALALDERMVTLVRDDAAPEAIEPPAPSAEASSVAAAPAAKSDAPTEPPKPKWKELAEAAGEGEPRKLIFVWYPADGGGARVLEQLASRKARELDQIGAEGGLMRVDLGKLHWGEFDADAVHERLLERGGTFRDAIRVNLSTPGQFCVLNLLFPRGTRGSLAAAERVLARFPARTNAAPAPTGK